MIHVTPKQQQRDGGIKHYVYDSKQTVHDKLYIPKHDINTSRQTLYRYLQSNEYVTYEGRGQASRWSQLNAEVSSTVMHDLVIIDLSKLWTMRSLTNKHANTMRKFAHKIKVNAFKLTKRTGDKQI